MSIYTAKDRVGRHLSCSCAARGRQHPACMNCLILVGAEHVENELRRARLPVYTDRFDPARGLWLRGWTDVPARVCFRCWDEHEAGVPYTPRLDPRSPRVRLQRLVRWYDEQHLPLPQGRLRGFERVDTFPEGVEC